MFKMSIFLLLILANIVYCWDSEELELFDLVEEVNENFYELIGVSQNAGSSDIRKAYRKLSLQLHPDKNKEADAEIKFRQLVAVYEVLKDEEKRARYNHVLETGLPDWRQPVFYYRRVRRMGLLELAVLLTIIFTVAHFLVIWSIYIERRFEQEEVFRSRKKRDKKGKKARQQEETNEELLQEQLSHIPRPKLTDLLPIKMGRGMCYLVVTMPGWLREAMVRWREEKFTEEEEHDITDVRKPRRQRVATPDADFRPGMSDYQAPVSYVSMATPDSDDPTQQTPTGSDDREWTGEDLALLSKAVSKFPGGTAQRWQRVAEYMGRTEKEVIVMARKVKEGCVKPVSTADQGITGEHSENLTTKKGKTSGIDDHIISTRGPDWSDQGHVTKSSKGNTNKVSEKQTSVIKNVKSVQKTNVTSLDNGTDGKSDEDASFWSQNQQKILEWCLAQYPKGTPERWEKIASNIPGKTKEECITRFKLLAEMIRQKKKQTAGDEPSS